MSSAFRVLRLQRGVFPVKGSNHSKHQSVVLNSDPRKAGAARTRHFLRRVRSANRGPGVRRSIWAYMRSVDARRRSLDFLHHGPWIRWHGGGGGSPEVPAMSTPIRYVLSVCWWRCRPGSDSEEARRKPRAGINAI